MISDKYNRFVCSAEHFLWEAKDKIRQKFTLASMRLIEVLNPSKDSWLSRKLHRLADGYDTRPTGEWD